MIFERNPLVRLPRVVGAAAAVVSTLTPLLLVLVAGVPVHPGGDLLPPVGTATLLRVPLVVVAVAWEMDLHDVVEVQAEVSDLSATEGRH